MVIKMAAEKRSGRRMVPILVNVSIGDLLLLLVVAVAEMLCLVVEFIHTGIQVQHFRTYPFRSPHFRFFL